MTQEFTLRSETIPERLQEAGVAGAGGAGFPSYVKWRTLDSVDHLLLNHQESEPNYYADKWVAREYADQLGNFLNRLVDAHFDLVVVGTKEKYRQKWMQTFEETTDATVRMPDDLPIDTTTESGIVVAYTPDVYTYSEESTLLMVTAGVQVSGDLPTEHGWIVHNTESLLNIWQALRDGKPVTRKYVQVDGNTPHHRCLDVPIGTPATALLEAAGIEDGTISPDEVLVDGGPGWCYEISCPPQDFGVRKRTNAILVLEEGSVREQTDEDGRTNVLDTRSWNREHEMEPTRLQPNRVRVPLLTNQAYDGFVAPSDPIVDRGDVVTAGDVIAQPASDQISNTQHASIDGTVTEISDTHIDIETS